MKCTLTRGQSMFSCSHCRAALKKISDDYYLKHPEALMNHTDEMKLGKTLSDAANESPDRYADLVKNHQQVGRTTRKTSLPPEMAAPYGIHPDPIERFSVVAQLQLMKALAILGWAAFILELLRV